LTQALDPLVIGVHAVDASGMRLEEAGNPVQVQVQARPGEFDLDPRTTAVIVVDMQNDFAAPQGMFAQSGIPTDGIRSVIEPTKRVLDEARAAGILVVYLAMQFDDDLENMGPATAPNRERHLAMGVGQTIDAPDGSQSRILVRGTWNTQIVEELTPHDDDIVVTKHRYSGFFETELDAVLRSRGITSLLFTGCTTSVCVESTLRDAFYRDYRCLLLTDCCAESIGSAETRTNHDATIAVVEALFGWTTESHELHSALARSGHLAAV
jgi:ureidoacrylate peracid hydrolase